MLRRRLGLSFVGVVVLLGMVGRADPADPASETQRRPLVVFLVRHAEKVKSGRDPALTEAGKQRAAKLSSVLRDAGIEHVHSTDFRRTRETAAPVAGRLKLPVASYNPRDLRGFAESLRKAGGRHLVVGHSNTTPALVKQLGGDPGEKIKEADEYDRLYVVSVDTDGKATTVLLRYGEAP